MYIIRLSSHPQFMVRYLSHAHASLQIIRRAILHDPAVYSDPDAFNPSRFLNSDGSVRDDSTWSSGFGYGKRICPGRHFVDATMFIVVASLFSVFNIERVKRADGSPEEYSFMGTGITYVSCSPRSAADRRLFSLCFLFLQVVQTRSRAQLSQETKGPKI